MKFRQSLFFGSINPLWMVGFISLLLACALLISNCAPAAPAVPTINIAGASDVIHIAEAVKQGFQHENGIQENASPSLDAVADLQTGKADIALVGRELSASELQGLVSKPVAYDAVCILIGLRAYNGGIQQGQVAGLIQPASRFDGLKNLTLDDVKGHIGNLLNLNKGKSYWSVSQMGYYTFSPYLVGDTMQVKEDSTEPGHALGDWIWNYVPVGGEFSTPGLTDAQTFLLQRLGFGQANLKDPAIGFIPPNVTSEEEWISSRFEIMPEMEKQISSVPFSFFLLPASRQVTVRALQHGFELRALSIDGVDPLADPKVIYDGSYPLQRKIYVIAKQPLSINAQKMIDYLLSAQGQKEIEQASYLPLPK